MKTKIQQHTILLAFFLACSCASPALAQNAESTPSTTDAAANARVGAAPALQLSAGDLLDVNVFDTPELSGKLRVNEHGAITLALGGDLAVSGMTAEQAGQAIEKKFLDAGILKDPHVSVTVLEYATQGVTILGEVKNPGVYPLLGVHGLLDLISAAGGETPSAGKAVTLTHRSDPGHPIVVTIETKPGSTADFHTDIRPGDTIMVSHAGIVYVIGDVGKPGGFLIENNDRLTVLEAIALAQGTNRTASLNRSLLIRKTAGARVQLPVPLKKILANHAPDVLLADGDILFIPVSGPKNAMRDVEAILPSAASAAIFRVP
jgi:polysaccharide export outer membrane protein